MAKLCGEAEQELHTDLQVRTSLSLSLPLPLSLSLSISPSTDLHLSWCILFFFMPTRCLMKILQGKSSLPIL